MLHRISIAVLAALLLIIAASCGHGNNTTLPTTMGSPRTASSHTASIEKALTELDSLPCPAGVTPETWAKVKDSFRNVAQDRLAGKEALQLQDYDYDTAVPDLKWEQPNFNGLVALTWGYVLPGDYNQNGLVEISDLTPLAQNYNQAWSGDVTENDYDLMPAVCDGDKDNTVDSDGDVAKIFDHFDDTIAGYSIEGDSVVDSPPTPSQYSTIFYSSHDDVGPKPYQARLRYHKEISSVSATSYYWVRPYDMEAVYPAVPSYGEYSTDYADLRPEIGPIKPQTPSGQHGSLMKFSYLPDTAHPVPIVSQEWDFGDAGTPDSSTSATPTLTLADDPGYYECSLTIENPYGSDTETFYVTVTQNQSVPVVNSVSQSTTEPGASATFTAEITNLPITTYSWRFNFNPPRSIRCR